MFLNFLKIDLNRSVDNVGLVLGSIACAKISLRQAQGIPGTLYQLAITTHLLPTSLLTKTTTSVARWSFRMGVSLRPAGMTQRAGWVRCSLSLCPMVRGTSSITASPIIPYKRS